MPLALCRAWGPIVPAMLIVQVPQGVKYVAAPKQEFGRAESPA